MLTNYIIRAGAEKHGTCIQPAVMIDAIIFMITVVRMVMGGSAGTSITKTNVVIMKKCVGILISVVNLDSCVL